MWAIPRTRGLTGCAGTIEHNIKPKVRSLIGLQRLWYTNLRGRVIPGEIGRQCRVERRASRRLTNTHPIHLQPSVTVYSPALVGHALACPVFSVDPDDDGLRHAGDRDIQLHRTGAGPDIHGVSAGDVSSPVGIANAAPARGHGDLRRQRTRIG